MVPLLVGFGNPTVDVTVHVTIAELSELGLRVGSEIASASQDTKERVVSAALSNPCTHVTPGGAALNSMRVAAWSGKESIRASFLGSVGQDANAKILTDAMHAVGVTPLLLEVASESTGVCAALVENISRDRSLATVRGAAGAITPEFLRTPAVASALQEASLLYATSFVLTTPARAACAMHMAGVAAARGVPFALNLSSAGMLPKVDRVLANLLPMCGYVFGNAEELRAFARLRSWDTAASDMECAKWLAAMLGPGGAAVITAGPESTLMARKDGEAQFFRVPIVPKDDIMDTNGCGDAFVGGFLAKAVQGLDLPQCIDEGHRCAGIILCRCGCSLD